MQEAIIESESLIDIVIPWDWLHQGKEVGVIATDAIIAAHQHTVVEGVPLSKAAVVASTTITSTRRSLSKARSWCRRGGSGTALSSDLICNSCYSVASSDVERYTQDDRVSWRDGRYDAAIQPFANGKSRLSSSLCRN